MFIVFEGIDGCGKGTQAERAAEYLRDSFGHCTLLKYPDRSTPIGALIDRWLHGTVSLKGYESPDGTHGQGVSDMEQALFGQSMILANKIEVQPKLMRALRHGHVIADRYSPSAAAYGAADGLDIEWLMESHSELLPADLTILLDIPTEVSFKRRPKGREAYENDVNRLNKARQTYLRLAKANPKKWTVIDGTQHPERIAMKIADTLNWFYQQGV